MPGDFVPGEAVELVRQHEPLIGFVQVKVRAGGAAGAVPECRDTNLPRQVTLETLGELRHDSLRVTATAEDIVHDQQAIVRVEIFQQILLAMHADGLLAGRVALVLLQAGIRRAQGDVVRFHTQRGKAFLHHDAHAAAAAPEAHDEGGPEPADVDLLAQTEAVENLLGFCDKNFCARFDAGTFSVGASILTRRWQTMSEKQYLDAQGLLEDSFKLAADVYHSGFRPTFIVAVWRGGAPIGIAVQEYFAFQGVSTDHIAIRTSAYSGIDNRARTVAVYGLGYLIKNLTHEDALLIVDDVWDTGHTVKAIIDEIRARLRRNTPAEIRVAVPYYKPARNETELVPDYFVHETERWLKYPHSLEGLTLAEMRTHRPEIFAIIGQHLPASPTDS